MATPTVLMGVGLPDQLAKLLGKNIVTLAGTGTTQALGKVIKANTVLMTTSGGATAFTLSTDWAVGDQVQVFNTSATAALLYPPSGSAFDGGSTDASVSIPQNASKTYTRVTTTSWRSGASVISGTTGTFSGAVTAASVAVTAGLTSSGATGAGIGYTTGAGGTVTQATNRTTGVTLNTLSGAITTNNASLGAELAAEFTVTNSTVAIGDTVILSQRSGSNGGNTKVFVSAVAAGSFNIKVANDNAAGGTAETGAIIINYAVIKAVSS